MLIKLSEFSGAYRLFGAGLNYSPGILNGLVKVSEGSLTVGVTSAWRNPASCFHVADVTRLGCLWHVISKKSLKRQWFCSNIKLVARLSTRYTLHAWNGLGPKLSPNLARGDHLDMVLPATIAFYYVITEHANVWWSCIHAPTHVPVNISNLKVPLLKTGTML